MSSCSSWFAAGAELRSSPLTANSSLLASLRESNGRQTDAVTRRDFRLSAIFLPLTNRRIHDALFRQYTACLF